MSSQRQVNFRDLVEEGKKRIVVLLICVVGLSYLMSLTSTSVLVNLPAAASLIILLRYFSLDFEMRRKAAAYNSKHSPENLVAQNKPPDCPKAVAHSDWRRNVNSPVVEDAIDKFTRHLVAEWVTDLWYSRLTPDKEGPEELVQIINGVLGEFSGRVRNVNLVDLLTRDLVSIVCTHLELFRASKAKIEKQHSEALTVERRDIELRRVLASSNKLHPALFSAEAEHKVLQFLMDSFISFTFRPQDLQCSFFRYIVRELLACAVMRPVLNLPSPRFINERIEGLAISVTKRKGAMTTHETSQAKPDESSKISSDHFSKSVDPSVTGVELIQLKTDQAKSNSVASPADNQNGSHLSKDPLLSLDTRSTRSWGSLPMNPQASDEKRIQRHLSGGEWPDKLDLISHRKTQALAPEHFENMWTKGRNYKRKESEDRISEQYSAMKSGGVDGSKAMEKPKEKDTMTKAKPTMVRTITDRYSDKLKIDNSFQHPDLNNSNGSSVASYPEEDDTELGSSNSYTSEDEETDSATGLDSPVTKVWDGKSNRNLSVSHIHHPLENPNGHILKKTSRRRVQHQRLSRTQSGRKRFRLSGQRLPIWQEVERTSVVPGDGQDVLNSQKGQRKVNESSTESESERLSQSGEAASSCASFITVPENHSLTVSSMQNSLMVDSFFKLRCEVVGANIVKSDSRTFAVYSISVTDSNNNSWSIKRRFRHFEELHRRLKFFGEYDLHLPPKHFLSTGLDVSVIQERCKLLDSYLKKLLQIPRVSGSIEVWDFLSVDSQTYAFLNSFSIVETLSVDLEDKPSERSTKFSNSIGNLISPSSYRKEHLNSDNKESACAGKTKDKLVAEGQKVNVKENFRYPASREHVKPLEDSRSGLDASLQKGSPSLRNLDKPMKGRQGDGLEETSDSLLDASNDPTLPTEWVPPNLSVPILDLVDVIFQLQDGGWIRRKAFWVAKQVLQLGMGDAFDDWLIEKIQLLRRGSVLASGINRLEQILWPDGIFLTKHPKRRQPPPSSPSQSLDSPHVCAPAEISSPRSSEEQEEEADRRAKFVYELMIDKAPAPIVGLVGRKEYEQCAKDLYLFIQSSVCLKHLVFDLLELLLLSAVPEMEYAFKQVHEEKHRFGEFKEDL